MTPFQLAIRAQIPVIGVTTNDLVNVADVLGQYCEKGIAEYVPGKKSPYPAQGDFMWYAGDKELPFIEDLYKVFSKRGASLIMVNQKESLSIYNAGELPTPPELIMDFLVPEYMDKAEAHEMMPCFGGMSLKEVTEVLMLTQARDGGTSASGVMKTRQEYKPVVQGLELVPTSSRGYVPNKQLKLIAETEKHFFLGDVDVRLRPRGILANGKPGTGKSLGARYLARQWGVPLYRLDATVQSKWIGESESNMQAALKHMESCQPGILLIDECEKLFGGDDGSGVTSKMLGSLLWWLQEHRERVFTFMTCNNMTNIPPELYRSGRIDTVLTFQGLFKSEVQNFCEVILKSFKVEKCPPELLRVVDSLYAEVDRPSSHVVAQSRIYSEVVKFLKTQEKRKPVDSKKKKVVR